MLIKVTWQEDRSVPHIGLHQGEAAIPQSKTADRLNTKSLTLTCVADKERSDFFFNENKKKSSLEVSSRQILLSQVIGNSGNAKIVTAI